MCNMIDEIWLEQTFSLKQIYALTRQPIFVYINCVITSTVGIDCAKYFKRSLFLVGEIGGNDYNYPFFVGGSVTQLKAMVPAVVETIAAATSVSLISRERHY